MYPQFAYTTQMQVILFFVTIAETFFSTFMMSNVMLKVSGLQASKKHMILFALLTGTVAQNIFIYAIYILSGMVSFGNVLYYIIVSPNPIHALIYYHAAQKLLGLSKVRSVKLTSYIYLIWLVDRQLNRVIGSILFVQNDISYNYMKDALQQAACFIIFLAIYLIVVAWIKRKNFIWKLSDTMFFNRRKEIIIYLLKASFAYSVMVVIPILLADTVIAYTMGLLILLLFVTVIFCLDSMTYKNQTISRHEIHISTLSKGTEELRGIKHDFNNILHTYNGFLELEEYEGLKKYHASLLSATSHAGNMMELAQKMHENPAIISLLMNKLEQADKLNVKLIITLKCSIENMHIDNMDASRILSCLLDNAIEAACTSERRKAYLSIESKAADSKIIIVSNSTSEPVDTNAIMINGMSTKRGHKGIGLSIIRSILNKYGNSSFQMKFFDQEVSSYIELTEHQP